MMAVGAFNQVSSALRWYVNNFGSIAVWKAALYRVSSFRHALATMEAAASHTILSFKTTHDGSVVFKDIEVRCNVFGPSVLGTLGRTLINRLVI